MLRRVESSLDRTLVAIADPTRRAILTRLMEGEARVTELARPFDMSLNAVSKHVRVLEGAGLVRRTVKGRVHLLAFEGEPLEEAGRCIDRFREFWEVRLEALDEFLKHKKKDGGKDSE